MVETIALEDLLFFLPTIKIVGYVLFLRRVIPKNNLEFIAHDFNRGL